MDGGDEARFGQLASVLSARLVGRPGLTQQEREFTNALLASRGLDTGAQHDLSNLLLNEVLYMACGVEMALASKFYLAEL